MTNGHKKASDLAVYVDWSTITKWKSKYTSDKNGNVELPYAYASDQRRLYNLAGPGTVVWVFSAPIFASYRLPPTLIARLLVNKVFDKTKDTDVQIPEPSEKYGIYGILADKSQSKYFPLNNAYQMLLSLTFVGKSTTLSNCPHCEKLVKEGKGLYAGIPAHLQTIRQLSQSSAGIIKAFAHAVDNTQVVFISYRTNEAKDKATKLAESLTAKNFSCWYDNWMIPELIEKRKIWITPNILSSVLADGLRQATYFIALVTSNYHNEGTWTEREWESALVERKNMQRRHPFKLVEVLINGRESEQADISTEYDGANLAEKLLANQVLKGEV